MERFINDLVKLSLLSIPASVQSDLNLLIIHRCNWAHPPWWRRKRKGRGEKCRSTQPPVAFGISFITERSAATLSDLPFRNSFGDNERLGEEAIDDGSTNVEGEGGGGKERRKKRSRFLCAGKRPSVLLWFQLLCPSVNRVISHGPRCTHDIRSSSTWGPIPSFEPPSFALSLPPPGPSPTACCTAVASSLFHLSTDRYFPHGTECLSTMCPLFFGNVLTCCANIESILRDRTGSLLEKQGGRRWRLCDLFVWGWDYGISCRGMKWIKIVI